VIDALRRHWPEYAIEAVALGAFMAVAGAFGTLLEHPDSPIRSAIEDPLLRRVPMGLAMGLTAIAIIHSPWGRQSGAHMNPAVTLTYLRLGKVEPWDAVFYVLAQLLGGVAGLLAAASVLGGRLADPAVAWIATRPGPAGALVAFAAESLIAFLLMGMILVTTNSPRLARSTGVLAGAMVATFIVVEAPLSGMSLNPARSLASALPAGTWTGFWVYLAAPPLGMLAAAQLYRAARGVAAVRCAKLNHATRRRCIFRCGYAEERRASLPEPANSVRH
jgi:aquaporin Z